MCNNANQRDIPKFAMEFIIKDSKFYDHNCTSVLSCRLEKQNDRLSFRLLSEFCEFIFHEKGSDDDGRTRMHCERKLYGLVINA
jgi:hypothetical protein